MKGKSRAGKLLQTGIIYSAINFLTGLGNMAFQSVLGHHLKIPGQYSVSNGAINAFMPLLSLPPQVAIFAVTHYIAHFDSIGDLTRLQGLLAGCRKFLLHLTIFGSLLAIVAITAIVNIKPLGHFFNYSTSLMLVTLGCTLLGLWTSLITAWCQGLAWFKRLALIAFVSMVLRVSFGYAITLHWPCPETAVLASTFGVFSYLILLYWRKDLSLPKQAVVVSPWNQEFTLYLTISTAYVIGQFCFLSGDLLVMQRYNSGGFFGAEGDAYVGAERLAVALPITVAPLLTVLFTNRSVEHTAEALRAQMKLIALFAGGLLFGAISLYLLKHPCLKVLDQDTPEAAAMIPRLSVTMIFVGLLQAVGTWALASRWSKMALLYGALGVGYLGLILTVGKTPTALLQTMPVAAGTAFVVLFTIWVAAMRRHKPTA
jgi:hypothetical protein